MTACLDEHLLCYMIIVVIFICHVFDQVAYMFHIMFT